MERIDEMSMRRFKIAGRRFSVRSAVIFAQHQFPRWNKPGDLDSV
jgi:hypothetical protein